MNAGFVRSPSHLRRDADILREFPDGLPLGVCRAVSLGQRHGTPVVDTALHRVQILFLSTQHVYVPALTLPDGSCQ